MKADERTLAAQEVGLLILDAVVLLHARGYERVRVHPGVSPSGMHWRISVKIARSTMGSDQPRPMKTSGPFFYSTGSGDDVAGLRVSSTTSVNQMANWILDVLGNPSTETDPGYVRWFAELVALSHASGALPIAYADYFDPKDGWEIGWGSGLRIPHPPAMHSMGESSAGAVVVASTGPVFSGTVAEFKRYTGAQWRVLVQTISKNFKASVGQCQHCGEVGVPFDAAHIHGRERTTLIHSLLGHSSPEARVTVDLEEFEAAFKAQHVPPERSLLVLCKCCHVKYDSKSDEVGATAPDSVTASSPEQESRLLPISLDPPGEQAFKEAILKTRRAWIDVTYTDGATKRRLWKADKLRETSKIMGNLRSREEFEKDAWQVAGIVTVHVTVAPNDAQG